MRLALVAIALGSLAFLASRGAIAGDPPKPPAGTKPDKPAEKPREPASAETDDKGPEIRWALSLTDAVEEAAERNVLLYVHSHGST